MPPSGYSRDQSAGIRATLYSCAAALEAEAGAMRLPLAAALKREITNISKHLSECSVGDSQSAILLLTAVFYRKVFEVLPSEQVAYSRAVEHALDEIEEEMLTIKIEEPLG
jgi:hypothetical protein